MSNLTAHEPKLGDKYWEKFARDIDIDTDGYISFEEFEKHAKDQLNQAFAEVGFDADRDVSAITVNRWPHGYSYSNKLVWSEEYAEEEKPWVIGRKPFGNIHIANSDANVKADTQTAIAQGYRAVNEIFDVSSA